MKNEKWQMIYGKWIGSPPLLGEDQFHESRGFIWIVVIALDIFKAQGTIHRNRLVHLARQCVESQPRVAQIASSFNNRLGQCTSQTLAAKLRSHIQPLHLANSFTNLSQRNATCYLIVFHCQEQTSVRWRVVPRKLGQLLIEVLEAEIESEPRSVLFKEPACLLNLFV